MKKLLTFVLMALFLVSTVAAIAPVNADPYADAVKSQHRVDNANRALGAPDGQYATLKHGIFGAYSELVLDMGEGEEIYGGPYEGDQDFTVIEVDGRELPDCANVYAEISEEGEQWVGLACHNNGFTIPDHATARYIRITNYAGTPFEVDAIVAKYYMPNDVPEFGLIGALVAVAAIGGFALYRRKD